MRANYKYTFESWKSFWKSSWLSGNKARDDQPIRHSWEGTHSQWFCSHKPSQVIAMLPKPVSKQRSIHLLESLDPKFCTVQLAFAPRMRLVPWLACINGTLPHTSFNQSFARFTPSLYFCKKPTSCMALSFWRSSYNQPPAHPSSPLCYNSAFRLTFSDFQMKGLSVHHQSDKPSLWEPSQFSLATFSGCLSPHSSLSNACSHHPRT